MEQLTWKKLYNRSVEICHGRDISKTIYAGSVAATLLTDQGHVYSGISIDTACSMGYCAERNAIGSMLTQNDSIIERVVAVRGSEIVLPCGVCREFMMQLNPDGETEFLVSLNPLKILTLNELLPHYWDS